MAQPIKGKEALGPSVCYVPLTPKTWRASVRYGIERYSLEVILRMLEKDQAWLDDALREDLPERDRLEYAKLLQRYVEKSPNFSFDEIASANSLTTEELQEYIAGQFEADANGIALNPEKLTTNFTLRVKSQDGSTQSYIITS